MTKRATASTLAQRNPKKQRQADPDVLKRPIFLLTRRNWDKGCKSNKEELRALEDIARDGLDYADLELMGMLAHKAIWDAYVDGIYRGSGKNREKRYMEPAHFAKATVSLIDTLRRVKDSRRLAEQGSGPGNIAMVFGGAEQIVALIARALEERGQIEAANMVPGLVIDVTPGAPVVDDPGRGDRLEVA